MPPPFQQRTGASWSSFLRKKQGLSAFLKVHSRPIVLLRCLCEILHVWGLVLEIKAQLRYLLLGAKAFPVTSDTPNGSHFTACSVWCVLRPLISYFIVSVLSPGPPTPQTGTGSDLWWPCGQHRACSRRRHSQRNC